MKTILPILIIIASGCAQQRYVHNDFKSYLNIFETEAQQRHNMTFSSVNMVIDYTNELEENIDARCYHTVTGPVILVNKTTWKSFLEDKKELIIFHELGHCLLGREHVDEMLPKGPRTYKSIMFKEAASVNDYSLYREAYLDELFQ